MVNKSPKDRATFPFQMVVSWLINGGDPNHLQVLGAHPPSTVLPGGCFHMGKGLESSSLSVGMKKKMGNWGCFTLFIGDVSPKV